MNTPFLGFYKNPVKNGYTDEIVSNYKFNYFPDNIYPTQLLDMLNTGDRSQEQLPCVGLSEQSLGDRRRIQKPTKDSKYGTVPLVPSHIGQSKLSFINKVQDGNPILLQPSNFNYSVPSGLGKEDTFSIRY